MNKKKTLTFPGVSPITLIVTPYQLGSGQYGKVYFAYNQSTQEAFAVKVVDRKKIKHKQDIKNL
jgi:hypothetical protein